MALARVLIRSFGTQHVPTGLHPYVCMCMYVFMCVMLTCCCAFSVHKSSVSSMCLYSMSALLIHLCISLPKETVSLSLSQPHYTHTLPPTYPPLVGLIIACHFATHTHTCMHIHTPALPPSLPFSPSVSAILLFFYPSPGRRSEHLLPR